MSLVLFIVLALASNAVAQDCENIGTLLNCPYNRTMYGSPYYTTNSDRLSSIAAASAYLPQLQDVIDSNCSKQMLRFGCATLFPSCDTGYGPCRSLCHMITTECATEFVEHLQVAFVVLGPFLKCNE